jgi:hypothetical protein
MDIKLLTNCVKTVEQYNQIVSVLTHWGDDAFVKANLDNPIAKQHLRCHLPESRQHSGYNYKRDFALEVATQKQIL